MVKSLTFSTSFSRKPKKVWPISYERRAAIGSPSCFFVCLLSFAGSMDKENKCGEKSWEKMGQKGREWKEPDSCWSSLLSHGQVTRGSLDPARKVWVCVKSWHCFCICVLTSSATFYSEHVHLLIVRPCCLRVCQSEDSYCSSSYSRGPSR